MGDGLFSDQLGMHGWKYKKEAHYADGVSVEDAEAALAEDSALWKNWKGFDDSILILIHVGDDGTDISEGIVSVCK